MSSALADAVAALKRSSIDYWAAFEQRSANLGETALADAVTSKARPAIEPAIPKDDKAGEDNLGGQGLAGTKTNHPQSERLYDADGGGPAVPGAEAEPDVESHPELIRSPSDDRQPVSGDGKVAADLTADVKPEPRPENAQEDKQSAVYESPSSASLDPPSKDKALTVHKAGLIATLGRKLRSLFGGI